MKEKIQEKLHKVYNKISTYQKRFLNTKPRKVAFTGCCFLLAFVFVITNCLFFRLVSFSFLKNSVIIEKKEDENGENEHDGEENDVESILINSDPQGVEVWITDDKCCNEEYTLLGTTPYKWEVSQQDYSNFTKLKFEHPEGYYRDKIIEIKYFDYEDIEIDLEVAYRFDPLYNWEDNFQVSFLSYIGEKQIDSYLDMKSKGFKFYFEQQNELVACFGLKKICPESFYDLEITHDNDIYYLSISQDLLDEIESTDIEMTKKYWETNIMGLPSYSLLDIPINDAELIIMLEDGFYYLISDEGEKYKLFEESFLPPASQFKSYKTGIGEFILMFGDSTLYKLDLENKKFTFSKYLPNEDNYTCRGYGFGHFIDDEYVYCIEENYHIEFGEDQKLIRYSYNTDEYKEVGRIPMTFGRGVGDEDSVSFEKSNNGSYSILLNTFRNKDTLMVINKDGEIVYRSGDAFETFAHFVSDDEMIYVQSRECISCWDEEASSKLVKYNFATKQKEIIDEGDMYIDFSINKSKTWGFYRKTEFGEVMTKKAELYIINLSDFNKNKISDHSLFPIWLSDNLIEYSIPGKCNIINDGDSQMWDEYRQADHCYPPSDPPPVIGIKDLEKKRYIVD